jgi:hypothetical protein
MQLQAVKCLSIMMFIPHVKFPLFIPHVATTTTIVATTIPHVATTTIDPFLPRRRNISRQGLTN